MHRNIFRLADGKLDRQYLRTCAVYRALMRYGASEDWAREKLAEVGVHANMFKIWSNVPDFREQRAAVLARRQADAALTH